MLNSKDTLFSIERIVREYICKQIVSELKEINVVAGECKYNYNCHKNTTHIAELNKEEFIVASIYIDSGFPVIHFLNINEAGEYVDNTLGVHTVIFKHYYWKKIYRKDYLIIDSVFVNLRKEIRSGLPWYYRLLSKYNC